MDYHDFIDEVVKIRYNCLSKTGKRPIKIIVPNKLAEILGINDLIQVLGIQIEIIQSEEDSLKIQLG